ncbi:lysophospholipid acyltransferase family protein [Aureibacter tunicatorum]|nr:lysophospholipid acyltransferase family protein [Aureibacter tunicatorum]BDD06570.1 acetyltransferase [Aureibacter tunicatorum]
MIFTTRLFFSFISELILVLIFGIFNYRKSTIERNLKYCFPNKTDWQIRQISKRYYKHMCDLLVEPFMMLFCPKSKIHHYATFKNEDRINELYKLNQDIVILAPHYGNWENLTILPLVLKHEVNIAYQPLSNPFFNKLIKYIREKHHTKLIPKKSFYRSVFTNNGNKPKAFLLLADQSPSKNSSKHFIDFFSRKTAIQIGAEKIALKKNCPVFFIEIKKVRRHHYEYEFKELASTSNNLNTEHELLLNYYKEIENLIRKEPAYWLWSHNRWKSN